MSILEIKEKVENNQRLSAGEALFLYESASLSDLKDLALIAKKRYHKPDHATYLIMRIINYTNICVALCDYCSFYRLPGSKEGYVLSYEAMTKKIDEILALNGDFVGFNGGHNPKLSLDWYVSLFSKIRAQYQNRIEFYAMTVAEMMYISKHEGLSYTQTAQTLKKAGVNWITGGGAEILTNAFRKRHSPLKYTADDYMQAQHAILEAGVRSTATQVIGFDETLSERIEHLQRVRDLQDTLPDGLFSFLSWTYKPFGNELGGEEVSREEYWRHLAVSRLFLDNIKHIRTSVLTQNENALKGLHFGANDFDVPLEDEVTQKAGAVIKKDISLVLNAAKAEGFELSFRPMALVQILS